MWNSVKDKLPESSCAVLVVDSKLPCGYNNGNYEVCTGNFINGKWMWYSTHVIPTHWMPLPDAPHENMEQILNNNQQAN